MDMVDHHGRFVWYELLTTDLAAARQFYGDVLGWRAQDMSTPGLAYTLFTSRKASVSGLMELPEQARRMGATSRWVGYVAVDDVDAVVERIKRLGGSVYVPPTNSNIGRISVVADPQTATLALVTGLEAGRQEPAELGDLGRVGWHELLAADWKKAFAFYGELFGWQKTDAEAGPTDTLQLFAVGGQTIGCMFTKRPAEPVPFWLYYFNTDDIDAAAERVKTGGGQIFEGPYEVVDGNWIVRCRDPQGAAFSLQGKRSRNAIGRKPAASEVGWSTEWGGFSSQGRLLVNKPRNGRKADREK
jgi:predicted enzyme related to lactoylglutathione lyase